MGVVQDELKNMLGGEVKILKCQDCGFELNDKRFIAVVGEVIYLALQGQLEMVAPVFQKSSIVIRYMNQLSFKRLV